MARNKNVTDDLPGMTVDEGDAALNAPLQALPPEVIQGGAPGVTPPPLPTLTQVAPVLRTAVRSGDKSVPSPQRYRVVGAPTGINGERFYLINTATGQTKLREGKIIDPREYDFRALRAQGIKLEKIDETKDAESFGY